MKITLPSEYTHISLGEIPSLIADALYIDSDDIKDLIKYEATVIQWSEVVRNAVISGHLNPLNPMTLSPQQNVHGSSLKSSVITRAAFAKFLDQYGLTLSVSGYMSRINLEKPESKQRQREEIILNALRELKYDLLNLPVGEPGKKGLRYEIREFLKKNKFNWTESVFNKAWEGVLDRKEVKREDKA